MLINHKSVIMKKLVLLVFLLFSCSKDDNDNSITTDPVIGTWVDSSRGGTSRGIITIQSNGIALSAIEGDSCWFKSWRTAVENPDYTQVRRYYEFTYVCGYGGEGEYVEGVNEIIFSDNFNKMTFGDFIGLRHSGIVEYWSPPPPTMTSRN